GKRCIRWRKMGLFQQPHWGAVERVGRYSQLRLRVLGTASVHAPLHAGENAGRKGDDLHV
ncbi:hypothetical protein ACFL1X_10910, partial [Candidatus Hydrogenedentota bacterium]